MGRQKVRASSPARSVVFMIANGQPLSVVVGNAKCRKGAKIFQQQAVSGPMLFHLLFGNYSFSKSGCKRVRKWECSYDGLSLQIVSKA